MADKRKIRRQRSHSFLSKENLETALGTLIVVFELVNAEVLGRTFHYEFLILAAGLFGLAIAGWGDKREGG